MESNNDNKLKIETIGVPSISSLSKAEYAQFISSLEFQIREYYKNLSTKKDKKPPWKCLISAWQ